MGSLLRIALIALVIYVGWTLFRRLTGKATGGSAGTPPPAQAPGQERMCQCTECGTHVPQSMAVRFRDKDFCSPAHLSAWQDRNPQG